MFVMFFSLYKQLTFTFPSVSKNLKYPLFTLVIENFKENLGFIINYYQQQPQKGYTGNREISASINYCNHSIYRPPKEFLITIIPPKEFNYYIM